MTPVRDFRRSILHSTDLSLLQKKHLKVFDNVGLFFLTTFLAAFFLLPMVLYLEVVQRNTMESESSSTHLDVLAA